MQVKYIGVSNETSFGVMEFIRLSEQAGLPRMHTIQNSYSLLVRSNWEGDLSEVCSEKDVSLLAYSPLASGTLTGKYISLLSYKLCPHACLNSRALASGQSSHQSMAIPMSV